MTELLFDKFEIIDILKKDQHTSVYLANHIYLGKKIILKTLATDELPDKTILERFKREAKILARLDHPNLIRVLDFGTAGNMFYISFEYFEGQNLRKLIKESKLDDNQKKHLCIQLFEALNTAHQNGIIHRDIKPENILVNSALQLKIADFGLALARDEHLLTHKSSIVGTPGYMSPEQIRGENLTPQTDLFSAGIVIYELFTNENPFIGRDINETVNKILNFNIEKEFSNLSLVPPEIQNLLKNLLRKNLTKRIKSSSDVLSLIKIEDKIQVITEKAAKGKLSKSILYASAAGVIIISLLTLFKVNEPTQLKKSDTVKEEQDKTSPDDPVKNLNDNGRLTGDNTQQSDINEIIEDDTPVVPLSLDEGKGEGRLFIEVNPWAEVYIDNKKIDTTPLDSYILLEEGEHNLVLIHPDYPSYSEIIEIKPNEAKTIKLNFRERFGFLDCRIFPWGEIFIDGEYKGTTPLQKPVVLTPGEHDLIIKNLAYPETRRIITITAKETLSLRINLDEIRNN
jgi:eukaryotic-like serine/threonine-protein kinase